MLGGGGSPDEVFELIADASGQFLDRIAVVPATIPVSTDAMPEMSSALIHMSHIVRINVIPQCSNSDNLVEPIYLEESPRQKPPLPTQQTLH